MEPRVISLVRYGLLGTMAFFSLIILGLSGNLINGNTNAGLFIPDFLAFDLAVAVITLVVIVVSVVIDFFRKGAFTSMVAAEIGWTFLLTVLWIAAAGDITALEAGLSCNFSTFDGDIFTNNDAEVRGCHETNALIAFSWLNFLMMLGWHTSLIVFAFMAYTRGQRSVWTGPVNGTDFFKTVTVQPQGQMAYGGVQPQYTGTPVQQQYTGGPMQQPYAGGQPPQTYPPTGYASPAPGGAVV